MAEALEVAAVEAWLRQWSCQWLRWWQLRQGGGRCGSGSVAAGPPAMELCAGSMIQVQRC